MSGDSTAVERRMAMTGPVRVTLSCIVATSLAVGAAACGGDDGSSADSDPTPRPTATALDGGGRQRDSSPPPSSVRTARDAADRFAVLRDESRLAKPSSTCFGHFGDQGPGSHTYLMRRQGGLYFCATVGQQGICVSTFRPRRGGHGGCFESRSQKLERFAEGRFGVATISTREGDLIYATVPDGTRDASITYRDGTSESVPIEDNFLGVVADKPPATVSWTTPDGKRFTSEP